MNFTDILSSAHAIKQATAQKAAIEQALTDAKAQLKEQVNLFFEDAPAGTEIENRALAANCGLAPSQTAYLLDPPCRDESRHYDADKKARVTRFAEVDASGQLVQGGRNITQRSCVLVYTRK